MRRDPRIINLYDKPLYARPQMRPDDRFGSGSAFCACLMIALLVTGFFCIYGALVYRGPLDVPTMTAKPMYGRGSWLVAPEAPAPDMRSPAVAFANADVPAERRVAEAGLKPSADVLPKKKPKVQMAKRIPPDAARAYASAPDFFRIPYGGL